jgi:hypothetical protein
MLPPVSRMAPLSEGEFASAVAGSALGARLARPIDRESAHEMLAARMNQGAGGGDRSGGTTRDRSNPPAEPAPGSVTPVPPVPKNTGPGAGASVAAGAAAVLGGLFRFATSREGQRLIRGVLGTPTRRQR